MLVHRAVGAEHPAKSGTRLSAQLPLSCRAQLLCPHAQLPGPSKAATPSCRIPSIAVTAFLPRPAMAVPRADQVSQLRVLEGEFPYVGVGAAQSLVCTIGCDGRKSVEAAEMGEVVVREQEWRLSIGVVRSTPLGSRHISQKLNLVFPTACSVPYSQYNLKLFPR